MREQREGGVGTRQGGRKRGSVTTLSMTRRNHTPSSPALLQMGSRSLWQQCVCVCVRVRACPFLSWCSSRDQWQTPSPMCPGGMISPASLAVCPLSTLSSVARLRRNTSSCLQWSFVNPRPAQEHARVLIYLRVLIFCVFFFERPEVRPPVQCSQPSMFVMTICHNRPTWPKPCCALC